MPALDPRALHGVGLAMASAPIGGDYRYAMLYEELLQEPPPWLPDDPGHPQAIRGRVPRLIWYERFAAAIDAAGLCRRLALLAFQVAPAEAAELLTAGVGRPHSVVEMARLGERIVTLERYASRRFTDATDQLPKRWATTPLPGGPAAGQPPPLAEMLADYYRRHGWTEDGDPTPARLSELGIQALNT
jgi:aldehyde:ferredoxin oxidoreductase